MKIDNLKLPAASRYLVSLFLKWGGKLGELEGTNAYVISLKKKEFIFFGEYTPFIPYMYGIVFSNQKYWFEILKDLKIKFAWEPKKREKKILFLITKDHYCSALEETKAAISGDGKSKMKELIKKENLRRINSKDILLMPIKAKNIKLNKILKNKERYEISETMDYADISKIIDKKFIKQTRKIIDFLPGLKFLAFEVFVKNPQKVDKFTLGKVFVNPGQNAFVDLIKGSNRINFEKFIKQII